jgi:hypothetical protein
MSLRLFIAPLMYMTCFGVKASNVVDTLPSVAVASLTHDWFKVAAKEGNYENRFQN